MINLKDKMIDSALRQLETIGYIETKYVDYIIKHYDKLYVTYPARDFKMISYYIKNNCKEEYNEHLKDKFSEY